MGDELIVANHLLDLIASRTNVHLFDLSYEGYS